jgi:L-ascorbate metabolism protein UlaG (beta-lactamase superfamily)
MCPHLGIMPTRNPYYQGPITDHFDGLRFHNPGEPDTDRGLGDILRWRREARRTAWPSSIVVEQAKPAERVDGLRVTMVGHATLLVQVAGLNILTDPVWSDRASPLSFAGPRRVTAPGIAFADLPPINAVLLSHNHYDHLDVATLKRLHAAHRPLIVTPLGNDAIVRKHVHDARIVTGDWGDTIAIASGAMAHVVPALHWSARARRERRMALWGGFVLEVAGRLTYFAGDTGYGTGNIFRSIHERYGSPDVALLPIGAYDPRWFMAAQHVDPEEAIQIMQDLKAQHAVAMHWGTFKLTDEPREDPVVRLSTSLASHGIAPSRFLALKPGEAADF